MHCCFVVEHPFLRWSSWWKFFAMMFDVEFEYLSWLSKQMPQLVEGDQTFLCYFCHTRIGSGEESLGLPSLHTISRDWVTIWIFKFDPPQPTRALQDSLHIFIVQYLALRVFQQNFEDTEKRDTPSVSAFPFIRTNCPHINWRHSKENWGHILESSWAFSLFP